MSRTGTSYGPLTDLPDWSYLGWLIKLNICPQKMNRPLLVKIITGAICKKICGKVDKIDKMRTDNKTVEFLDVKKRT